MGKTLKDAIKNDTRRIKVFKDSSDYLPKKPTTRELLNREEESNA